MIYVRYESRRLTSQKKVILVNITQNLFTLFKSNRCCSMTVVGVLVSAVECCFFHEIGLVFSIYRANLIHETMRKYLCLLFASCLF